MGPRFPVIIIQKPNLLSVVDIAGGFLQQRQTGVVLIFAEFPGDLHHTAGNNTVIESEHGICIIQVREKSDGIRIRHKKIGNMQ